MAVQDTPEAQGAIALSQTIDELDAHLAEIEPKIEPYNTKVIQGTFDLTKALHSITDDEVRQNLHTAFVVLMDNLRLHTELMLLANTLETQRNMYQNILEIMDGTKDVANTKNG